MAVDLRIADTLTDTLGRLPGGEKIKAVKAAVFDLLTIPARTIADDTETRTCCPRAVGPRRSSWSEPGPD